LPWCLAAPAKAEVIAVFRSYQESIAVRAPSCLYRKYRGLYPLSHLSFSALKDTFYMLWRIIFWSHASFVLPINLREGPTSLESIHFWGYSRTLAL
jgi:hypothetical protein